MSEAVKDRKEMAPKRAGCEPAYLANASGAGAREWRFAV